MRAGKSQTAAGKIIEVSPQTIGRMEDGLPTKLSRVYVNAICDEYQAMTAERDRLLTLAAEVEEAKKAGNGWWRSYPVAPKFDHYLALEDAAQKLTTFELTLLPGLLQIPEYRRDIIWVAHPELPTDEVEHRIELATRRQAKLDEGGFKMDVILSEAVLRHRVGGPSVIARQLRYLVEVGNRSNISIRVIPLHVDGHIGLQVGSFVLFEFPPLPSSRMIEPPVVYVEVYAGHLYLEHAAEIQRYWGAVDRLKHIALDEQGSRSLVLEIAKEFEA